VQDALVIGSVADDTKAVLRGATITATVSSRRADDRRQRWRGEYRLKLAPGTYKLQVELADLDRLLIPKWSCWSSNGPCR